MTRPCARNQGATPLHIPRYRVESSLWRRGTCRSVTHERSGRNTRRAPVISRRCSHARGRRISAARASNRDQRLLGVVGYSAFGLSLVPLLVGIGVLFFNGRSALGWALTAIGTLIILAGIVANLHLYFQPTTLFDTLLMLGLLAGGLGLIARSLRPQGSGRARDDSWAS